MTPPANNSGFDTRFNLQNYLSDFRRDVMRELDAIKTTQSNQDTRLDKQGERITTLESQVQSNTATLNRARHAIWVAVSSVLTSLGALFYKT